MKGAREYTPFLKSGDYGRLRIEVGRHARGSYLHVYVLPQADLNSSGPPVEVYGIVSGNPGWTEEYDWKHKGPWVEDFLLLVESGKQEKAAKEAIETAKSVEQVEREEAYKKSVLASYQSEDPTP